MKTIDITSVGSATIDLFMIGGKFTEKKDRLSLAIGGKYQSEDFTESIGGGGLNTAVGFSRLGLKTSFAGELSNDWLGSRIISKLKDEKVLTQYALQTNIKPSVSTILLGATGERTIISYIAPNFKTLLNSLVRKSIRLSTWLFFCDHKSSKNYKTEVLRYAVRNKTRIAVSLGKDEFRKGYLHNEEYLKLSDAFFLNAHELGDLTKRKYEDLDLIKTNYAEILKTKLLIVTDSRNGEYVYLKGKIVHRKAYPLNKQSIDTTGAGDAFAVGFLGSCIKERSLEESMDFGSKNAVSVISSLGAQTGLMYAG